MTDQDALNMLTQAASEFRGTKKDHEMLTEAVKRIQSLIAPTPSVDIE